MKAWRRGLGAAACMGLVAGASAQPAAPAPPFELAYRAWDLVTELARHNGDPRISGECGKTFRPFVSPGLRMQSRQDQDVAAAACVAAARAACRDDKLRRAPDTAAKCGEFR